MESPEDRLFAAVVSSPHETLSALARATDLCESEAATAMESLDREGLVERSQVSSNGWRAVSPALVLGRRVARQEQDAARALTEIGDIRNRLARLTSVYARHEGAGELIVYLADRDQVLMTMSDLVSQVTSEVAAFVTNRPSAEALEQSRQLDAELLTRGVRLRTIALDGFLRDRRMRRAMTVSSQQGSQIRTTPVLPSRMVIFDGRVAVLAVDDQDPGKGALLVSSPAVVRLLCDLFERYWSTSVVLPGTPAAADQGQELTAMERSVIQMLAEGQKDDAIARATGQSVRTVRRVVAAISAKVGARSRFDLALRAVHRGWISPTDS